MAKNSTNQKPISMESVGTTPEMNKVKEWVPAKGVSISRPGDDTKTSGVTMRGFGAATKGKVSRGPMA